MCLFSDDISYFTKEDIIILIHTRQASNKLVSVSTVQPVESSLNFSLRAMEGFS